MKSVWVSSKFFLIVCLFFYSFSLAEISEGDVLEWWDAGLLESAEVDDFLSLIEAGNEEEVCAFAEALGLETCEKKKKRKKEKKFSGKVKYRETRDSLGHFILRRGEASLVYEPWSFRGDTDSLWIFGYERNRKSAQFGTLDERALKISIPLFRRTGSWISFRGDLFSLGGGIFTNGSAGAMFSFKGTSAWFFSGEENALAFEATGENWNSLFWFSEEMKHPLFRASLSFKEKSAEKSLPEFSWNALFYFHSDSIQSPKLRLPAGVKNSRFWSSQSQKISFGAWNLQLVERVKIPLDSGKTNSRLEVKVQKTRGLFRTLEAFACRDFRGKCEKPQIRVEETLSFKYFQTYVKFREQGESFRDLNHIPRIVCGLGFSFPKNMFVRSEWIVPEDGASKVNPYRVSEEAGLQGDYAKASLRMLFNVGERLSPLRAGLSAEIFF